MTIKKLEEEIYSWSPTLLTIAMHLVVKRIIKERIFQKNISILRHIRHSIKPFKIETEYSLKNGKKYDHCIDCKHSKPLTMSPKCKSCAAMNRHSKRGY